MDFYNCANPQEPNTILTHKQKSTASTNSPELIKQHPDSNQKQNTQKPKKLLLLSNNYCANHEKITYQQDSLTKHRNCYSHEREGGREGGGGGGGRDHFQPLGSIQRLCNTASQRESKLCAVSSSELAVGQKTKKARVSKWVPGKQKLTTSNKHTNKQNPPCPLPPKNKKQKHQQKHHEVEYRHTETKKEREDDGMCVGFFCCA